VRCGCLRLPNERGNRFVSVRPRIRLASPRSCVEAARKLKLPVLVGVSEGEREFIGTLTAAAIVRSLRDESPSPIFLNADHTHSLEKFKEVAEAGCGAVIFDASKLPLAANLKQSKRAVEIANQSAQKSWSRANCYISSSSAILEKRPEESLHMTDPEEAGQFAAETGIDVVAPPVGNMHGLLWEMVSGQAHKHLDVPRIGAIKRAIGKFMTRDRGSGSVDQDFVAAITAWIVGLPPYGTRLAKKRARWVFIILGVFLISLKPVLTI
jgi:fructose-bisphosphate aldolase class II